MPFRILRYGVHTAERWLRSRDSEPCSSGEAKRPPTVLAFVVHHGARPWRASTGYAENLALHPEEREAVRGLVPEYHFLLDDLVRVSDEDLRARRMMTGQARLAQWILKNAWARPAKRLQDLERWMPVIVEAWRSPGGPSDLESFWSYYGWLGDENELQAAYRRIISELGEDMEETIMTYEKALLKKGRAEGRAEGRAQAASNAVLEVLRARGRPVSREIGSRVLACKDLKVLKRLLIRAATVESVTDSFLE